MEFETTLATGLWPLGPNPCPSTIVSGVGGVSPLGRGMATEDAVR